MEPETSHCWIIFWSIKSSTSHRTLCL